MPNKTGKTIVENVIIVLLLAILMMSFVFYFFKQEDNLTQIAFDRINQTFATKVTTVRAQWFMDKQPSIVHVEIDNEIQSIVLNHKGWIDVKDKELSCAKIWNIVMIEPMMLMKTPISAVEIKKHNMEVGRICQFELPLGEYFQYNSQNGKVSGVKSRSNDM
jgi:hypothetical protein